MSNEMKQFLTELADLFDEYNVEMDAAINEPAGGDEMVEGVDFFIGIKNECATIERCAKAAQVRAWIEREV